MDLGSPSPAKAKDDDDGDLKRKLFLDPNDEGKRQRFDYSESSVNSWMKTLLAFDDEREKERQKEKEEREIERQERERERQERETERKERELERQEKELDRQEREKERSEREKERKQRDKEKCEKDKQITSLLEELQEERRLKEDEIRKKNQLQSDFDKKIHDLNMTLKTFQDKLDSLSKQAFVSAPNLALHDRLPQQLPTTSLLQPTPETSATATEAAAMTTDETTAAAATAAAATAAAATTAAVTAVAAANVALQQQSPPQQPPLPQLPHQQPPLRQPHQQQPSSLLKDQILIIGDSNSAHFNLPQLKPGSFVTRIPCFTTEDAKDEKKVPKITYPETVKEIIFHLGLNDHRRQVTPEKIQANMLDTIILYSKYFPNARFHLACIPPISSEHKKVNEKLHKLSQLTESNYISDKAFLDHRSKQMMSSMMIPRDFHYDDHGIRTLAKGVMKSLYSEANIPNSSIVSKQLASLRTIAEVRRLRPSAPSEK